METKRVSIIELIPLLEAYNEQNTRFQIPNDIYCHSAFTSPLSHAVVRLEAFKKYWKQQQTDTLFFIWHEENMKVWNYILYEWELKLVVKICAENDKIKEFTPGPGE